MLKVFLFLFWILKNKVCYIKYVGGIREIKENGFVLYLFNIGYRIGNSYRDLWKIKVNRS